MKLQIRIKVPSSTQTTALFLLAGRLGLTHWWDDYDEWGCDLILEVSSSKESCSKLLDELTSLSLTTPNLNWAGFKDAD